MTDSGAKLAGLLAETRGPLYRLLWDHYDEILPLTGHRRRGQFIMLQKFADEAGIKTTNLTVRKAWASVVRDKGRVVSNARVTARPLSETPIPRRPSAFDPSRTVIPPKPRED